MNTTTLPDPAATTAVAPTQFGGSSQFARMRILIIDDGPSNVALLEAILADSGYTRLRSVCDSREALETCRTFNPDLVLLDLMMPYVDGFTILETLRAEPPDIFLPVIVLTADANEETKLRALAAGASDFLLKPFDQVEVLLRIGNLLMLRHLHIQIDTQRAAYEESLRARALELREAQAALERCSAVPR